VDKTKETLSQNRTTTTKKKPFSLFNLISILVLVNTFIYLFIYLFIFCSVGDQTQGLTQGRQVLYHRTTTPVLSVNFYFVHLYLKAFPISKCRKTNQFCSTGESDDDIMLLLTDTKKISVASDNRESLPLAKSNN
jgi:hypothetical protein